MLDYSRQLRALTRKIGLFLLLRKMGKKQDTHYCYRAQECRAWETPRVGDSPTAHRATKPTNDNHHG